MKQRGGKTGGSIDKKPPNSMRKQGEKLIICYFVRCCSAKGEKPPKPNLENGGGKPDAALNFLAPRSMLKKS